MPPPGLPRSPAQIIADVTGWLKYEFDRQDRRVRPELEQVSARRLNRAEYNNTFRDLLGIDILPGDNFSVDTAVFGFDNISDALHISLELLEKYIDAGERSVRKAIFGPPLMKELALLGPVYLQDNLSGVPSISC